MDNYGKCKNCEYGEPQDSGWKWYCTWYKTLEDPDEVRDCPHYTSRGSSGGCFLTTACCDYMGLPDDCHELQTLRKLRDEYISKQSYGEELIRTYYSEAPKIVSAINASKDKDQILRETYETICKIVSLVEEGKTDEAIIRYLMLFHNLYAVTKRSAD